MNANIPGLLACLGLLVVSGCGGGGSGTSSSAPSTNQGGTTPAPSLTVGGALSGLGSGKTVTLLNNGSNALQLAANGPFTFSSALAAGSAYQVTVGTQPAGQTCTVGGGSGTIASASIAGITVTCADNAAQTFTVGGTVRGNTGPVTLTNNGTDTLTVAAGGGGFSFGPQAAGSNWNVAATPPGGQSCQVTNGTGSNIAGTVGNVTVSCVDTRGPQTIGGSVSGLSGTLTLLNNRGDPLSVTANGSFQFAAGLAPLATYEATVGKQPAGQACSILNASGTVISISYTPTPASALDVTNVAVTCRNGPAFTGTILLGEPTDRSILVKLFTTDQNGTVSVSYGTRSGGPYTTTTPAAPVFAGTPATISLTGLTADTSYYYLVSFQPADGGTSQTPEYSFHTARAAGSAFTFAVQADSHLDENTDVLLYQKTLQNIGSDGPDFLIDLGDTFMTEKHNQALDPTPVSGSSTQTGSPPASTEQQVVARYRMDLKYFDSVTRSVPLFLANGNHDAEAGWIWNSTSATKGLDPNLASWAARARQAYFANPAAASQSFYKGQPASSENASTAPGTPARASSAWYAWQWGDALFIVLDPYWNSTASSGWSMSLGSDQYTWLASTLSSSTARFKFVFLHNLVGGFGSMRGGVEAAPFFEWGGYDATLNNCSPTCTATRGANLFASKRPGWSMPIHTLLVANKVTAVFHGHDHFYGQQTLDGIVYQEVPQPSARNTSNGPATATAYGYTSGVFDSSSGHLRLSVTPNGVRSEYVRAWLPAGTSGSTNVENGSTRVNRQVSQSWSCSYQSSGADAGWCR